MLKIKKETVRKSLFSYIIEKSLGGARFWPIFLFNFLFFFQLLTPCSKFEMEKKEKLLTLFFFASAREKKKLLSSEKFFVSSEKIFVSSEKIFCLE